MRKNNGNLENRINIKLLNNQKDYLKCLSKPSYMSHEIFDINLIALRKSKLALKLNKPVYIRICFLELSKIIMYEFHYAYTKKNITTNKNYNSQILIV